MKQFIILILILFLITKANAQPGAMLSNVAKTAFNKEDYNPAITELNKIIETQPNNEQALVERARCNYLSVSKEALVDKKSAELAKTNKDRVKLDRAVEAFVLGKISNGMADAEKAISINPNNASAFNIRGLLKELNRDRDGAMEDLSKSIAIDKNFIKPYFNRAALYEKKRDFDAALKDYSSVIALDSNNVMARRMRVSIHKNNGVKYVEEKGSKMLLNYYQMEGDLYRLMYLDSTNEKVYTLFGDLYTERNSGNGFYSDWIYERYKNVKPNAAEAHFKYAEAIASAKSDYTTGTKEEFWAKATPEFEKAILLDNSKVDYYVSLANHYLIKINDYNKSLQTAQKLIAKFPQEAIGHALAGNAYYQKNELDNALKSFSKAIELSPDYSYAYLYRSNVYKQKNDINNTLADFSKALEINPTMGEAYLARGNFYLEQKNATAAIKDLSEAINFKVSDKCAYVSRAKAYMLNAVANNEKKISSDNFKAAYNDLEKSGNCTDLEFYKAELNYLLGDYYMAKQYFERAYISYKYYKKDLTEVNARLILVEQSQKNESAALQKKSAEERAAKQASTDNNISKEEPVNVYAQAEAIKAYHIAMAKYNEATLEYNNGVARINADKVDMLFHKTAVLDKMYKKLEESENICRKLWQDHGKHLPRKLLKQILDCMDECSWLKIGQSVKYTTFYKFYGFL
jgi:tetratricopeptide (TPR) repeat protein